MIRNMQAQDLEKAALLYRSSNVFASQNDILAWTKAGFDQYPELNLVYEQNGRIIGAVSGIMLRNKMAIINDLAVDEDFRNQEIGTQLMQSLIKILKNKQVKKISLWIHWTNARAIPFCYRFGFSLKKVSRTFGITNVPDGEDIIHLEMPILTVNKEKGTEKSRYKSEELYNTL